MKRHVLSAIAAFCVLAFVDVPVQMAASTATLAITHGVASGDVTATTAIIWARASGPARMYVEVDTDQTFDKAKKIKKRQFAVAAADTDYAAQLKLTELESNTRYFYRVWLTPPDVDFKHWDDAVEASRGRS